MRRKGWISSGMRSWQCFLMGAVALACAANVDATIIQAGAGNHHATLMVEFGDGADYTFDVAFDGTTTGLGLFDIIEADPWVDLTTVRDDFGWGEFIDGIAYDGHSDTGFLGDENYWHYWVKDSAAASWGYASVGAADRVVEDGFFDGWVYGHANAPLPEPAAVMLLLAGGLIGLRRR